jgi:hypothetical protein
MAEINRNLDDFPEALTGLAGGFGPMRIDNNLNSADKPTAPEIERIAMCGQPASPMIDLRL